jgi:hypothetical protein
VNIFATAINGFCSVGSTQKHQILEQPTHNWTETSLEAAIYILSSAAREKGAKERRKGDMTAVRWHLPEWGVVVDEVARELGIDHTRVEGVDCAVCSAREAADELIGEEDVGELGLAVGHPRLVVFSAIGRSQ